MIFFTEFFKLLEYDIVEQVHRSKLISYPEVKTQEIIKFFAKQEIIFLFTLKQVGKTVPVTL